MMRRRLLIALLMSSVAFPALADKRVALVFGQDKYDTLRPLENAGNDAVAVEQALDKLGFEVSLETNRDLKRMRQALDDFKEDAAGADVALVYFAGHGVEVAGQNMLLPTDADASSVDALKQSSMPVEEVRTALAKVSKVNLVLLDACRNDPFGGAGGATGRGAVALAPTGEVQEIKPGLGRLGNAENLLYTFSAAPGATAADGTGENSPFTEALVKYLDTDGLEIRSVMTLVQQEVYDLSRGGQLPYVENGLPEVFFAATEKSDLPERERLLLAMADVNADLRDEVERLAREKNMPLAPLYGALISSDAQALNQEQRLAKLTEAADAFVATREQIKTLAAADPEVEALRTEAEKQLSLGAFDTARGKLDEAAAVDSKSREALTSNLASRIVSEATTHTIAGGAARTNLKYDLAIESYTKAETLYDEAGDNLTGPGREGQIQTAGALGDLYQTVGKLDDAAKAVEKGNAVAIEMAKSNPSNAAWQVLLADSNERLADIRAKQGRSLASATLYQTALDQRMQLAKAAPDDPLAQWELARTYVRLGATKRTIGDRAEALAAFKAGRAITEKLIAAHPDNVGMGRTYGVLSIYLGEMTSSAAGAEKLYQEAVDVYTRLAKADPKDVAIQMNWSAAEASLAGLYYYTYKDGAKAKVHYQKSFDISKRLLDSAPQDTTFQDFHASSMSEMANMIFGESGWEASVRAHDEVVTLRRKLVELDPSNAVWQSRLAFALRALSQSYMGDINDFDMTKPMEIQREAVAVRERLVEQDPLNIDWQRSAASELRSLAKLQELQLDWKGALRTYRQTVERLLATAEKKPEGLTLWNDAMETYDRIAKAENKVIPGRLITEETLRARQDALKVAHRMAELNPGVAHVVETVASATSRVAGEYSLAKDFEAALVQYQEALKLTKDAEVLDPVQYRKLQVAMRTTYVADTQRDMDDREAALRTYEEALAIGNEALAMDPDEPFTMAQVAKIYADVSTTLLIIGRSDESRAIEAKGLELVRAAMAASPDDASRWEYIVARLGGNNSPQ